MDERIPSTQAQARTRGSAMQKFLDALPFVSALVLILLLFQGTFWWWWHEWTYPGRFYAHAVFVPFFVAVMVWRNRESLLTFSAAFAYLVEGALWKRWTLFLTTIPLSLFINALRITFIGIVGELFSTKAAETFHDYSGFIVLTLAFLFLFNFARMLQ